MLKIKELDLFKTSGIDPMFGANIGLLVAIYSKILLGEVHQYIGDFFEVRYNNKSAAN